MNNVVFKNIEIQNFLSIEHIYFDYEKHSGLNYITGKNLDIGNNINDSLPNIKNGSGKSVIFTQAPLFTLFGRTLKNNNNVYIPNRIIGNSVPTKLTLNFSVNNINYTLITSLNNPGPCVAMQLFQDNIELTKSTVHKTREFIEREILNTTFDLFKNSIIISATNSSYNFFELNKNQKREYLESVFKMSCFGEMLKKIKLDISAIEKELLKLSSSKIQLNKALSGYITKNKEYENSKKEKIILKKEYLKEKENNVNNFILELSESDKEILKKYNKVEEKIIEQKTLLNSLRIELKEIININKHYQENIEKHSEILNITCEKCTDKIKEIYNINDISDKIEINNIKINDLDKRIDSIETVLNSLESYKKKFTIIYDVIKEKNKQIESNKLHSSHIKQDIEQLKLEILTLEKEVSPFESLIEKATEENNSKTILINDLEKKKIYLDILLYTVGEDGAKKFLISELIEVVNMMIQKYLEEMGADYTVQFNETLDCTFLTTTGLCEYDSFSAGERQRINIATLLTFRDIVNNGGLVANFFMLDEVLDIAIDSFCLKSILNILKRQSEEMKQTIYLVSHRMEATEEMLFDNIIEIEKKNGISRISLDSQGGIE